MLGDVWFIAHVAAVMLYDARAGRTCREAARLGRRGVWAACAFESRFSISRSGAGVRVSAARRSRASRSSSIRSGARRWCRWRRCSCRLRPYGCSTTTRAGERGATSATPRGITKIRLANRPARRSSSSISPKQLYSFFVQGATQLQGYPGMRPEITGLAITWTSPALVLAFFARKPTRLVVALWAAALLVAFPSFIYYVNGFAQFGMRHALDFEPFLVALIMLACRERIPQWGYILLTWSMLAGLWGCWYWNAFRKGVASLGSQRCVLRSRHPVTGCVRTIGTPVMLVRGRDGRRGAVRGRGTFRRRDRSDRLGRTRLRRCRLRCRTRPCSSGRAKRGW